MPHGLKVGNEYVGALGKFYADTPKAVFAAIAYSYASMFAGDIETDNPQEVITRLKKEWSVLSENGIVAQKVPNA